MRAVIGLLTVGCILTSYVAPARAIGCISGGLAGAVAGHMMHHGVLGAIGGCVAGHEYHKHQNRESMQNSNDGSGGYNTNRQGSGAYPNQE